MTATRSSGLGARAASALLASSLAVFAAIGGLVPRHDSSPATEPAQAAPVAVPVFCFDGDRPPSPEVIDWINSLVSYQVDYQLSGQNWANNGTPITLTWSFVPDGVMLPGLGSSSPAPSELFSRMNQRFNNNQALWISLFEQSFGRWSELTGVNFVRVQSGQNPWDNGTGFPSTSSSSSHGHFRIGMRPLDGPSGVLAFNYYPPHSDMVIDASETWQSTSNNYRFLRNVVMHELGHGLGVAHCCPINNNKLLEPTYSPSYDGPQHDDVRAIHHLHGDAYEPNNNLNVAVDLGPLEVGQTLRPSLAPGAIFALSSITSIDRLADQDWFGFSISAPMDLSASVAPIGTQYLSGPQLSGGQCSAGTATNSLTAGDLAIQVFGPNSSTLIATAAGNGAGVAETLSNITLAVPGNYYIRVYTTSSTGPQLYRVEMSGSAAGGVVCPSFTEQPQGANVCLGSDLLLEVGVTGFPLPTLQWRRNGQPIIGATGTSYQITSATLQSGGLYDVVATNSCGSFESDTANVIVVNPPEITLHPASQNVQVGEPITLVAAATGATSWRWYKDNELLPGEVFSGLQINSATPEDAGTYYGEAVNGCEAVPTNPAIITVGAACYANCDGSTTQPVLNVDDFTCFINQFASAQALPHAQQVASYANCDGSSTAPVLNVDDFTCFINDFAAGCP